MGRAPMIVYYDRNESDPRETPRISWIFPSSMMSRDGMSGFKEACGEPSACRRRK